MTPSIAGALPQRTPDALTPPGAALGPGSRHGNSGRVTSVRGSVVDVRFEQHLPPIHALLRAGEGGHIAIEVLAQSDGHHVRGIALTPTQGLARGMNVVDTGGPLLAPVGRAVLGRMLEISGAFLLL